MYSACTYVATASTVVSSFLPGETLLAVGTAWRVGIWYPVGLVLRGQSHSCKAKPCNKEMTKDGINILYIMILCSAPNLACSKLIFLNTISALL